MKKIVYILLILAVSLPLFCSCSPKDEKKSTVTTTTAALPESRKLSSDSDGSFAYDVYADYVEITAYLGSGAIVVVPSSYEGTPVMSIGNSAFMGNNTITSVTLPETVVNIGNKSFFKCENLTEIKMPFVKSFGLEAFRGSALTSVTLPVVLENFGKYSLAETQIKEVTLPSSIIRAGDYVFAGCQQLELVNFPDNMTEITIRMFYNCSALKEVTVPDTITKIGGYAYAACQNLTKLYIPATVTEIGEGLLYNSPNAYIVTTKNSAAHKYAEKNNIKYELAP